MGVFVFDAHGRANPNRLSCLANQSRVACGKEGFRGIDSFDESFENH